MRAWVSLDACHRRCKSWPLVRNERLQDILESRSRYVLSDVVSAYLRFGAIQNTTAETVGRHVFESFPMMQEVFRVGHGHVLLAGGSVLRSMFSHVYECDADFFFYDLRDQEEAFALLKRILQIFEYRRIHVTDHCVTVHCVDGFCYQFILRLYERPDQVLGGFDIPACGVGFAPSVGLIATPLAAFNIANRTIFVDTSRRSLSFEHRLIKYFSRGFRVVFSVIADVLQEDDDTFGGFCVTNGRLTSARLLETVRSDYDATNEPDFLFRYINILRAVDPNRVGEIIRNGDALLLDDFDKDTVFPDIVGCNEERDSRLDEFYKRRVRKGTTAALRIYQRWFGPDAEACLVAKITKDRQMLEAIRQRTVARIRENFAAARNKKLQFITIDPGRQFTGSFNPIWEHPTRFYPAHAYRSLWVGLTPTYCLAVWLICIERGLPRDIYRYLLGFVVHAVALKELENAGLTDFVKNL